MFDTLSKQTTSWNLPKVLNDSKPTWTALALSKKNYIYNSESPLHFTNYEQQAPIGMITTS